MGLVVAAALFLHQNATANTIDLGTASSFAVLAGSGITVAGAANTTTITGDIGTYPTTSVTGLGNVVLNGANQTANSGLMLNAQNDLNTAYGNAAGQSATVSYGSANQELGGLTLAPGVYNDSTSFGITRNPDARRPEQPQCRLDFPSWVHTHHGIRSERKFGGLGQRRSSMPCLLGGRQFGHTRNIL